MLFGISTFGKCDNVPGIGFVATKFLHVSFLPLIPLKGHFVLAGTEGVITYNAVDLPMSGKSVLLAWGRVAVIGLMLVAVAGVVFQGIGPDRSWLLLALSVLGVAATGGAFWASYRIMPETPARKAELLTRAGFAAESIAGALTVGEAAAAQGKTYWQIAEASAQQPKY